MSSSKLFIGLLLLLSILLIGGCREKDELVLAGEAYERGQYEEAEEYFLSIINTGIADSTIYIGYACTLLKMGDMENAEGIFKAAQAKGDKDPAFFSVDKNSHENLLLGLLDIYMQSERLEEAANIYVNLADISQDKLKQTEYIRKGAVLRQKLMEDSSSESESKEYEVNRDKLIDMYTELLELTPEEYSLYEARSSLFYEKGEMEKWEEDVRQTIKYGKFEIKRYLEIYTSYEERGQNLNILKLADELIVYVNAHSIYMDGEDYRDIISVLFRAAEIANAQEQVQGLAENTNNEDYYFDNAEKYIEVSGKLGIPDQTLERYAIVIAERRGKLELACKLLGVYLNHYPEDNEAEKEKNYLENRITVKTDK